MSRIVGTNAKMASASNDVRKGMTGSIFFLFRGPLMEETIPTLLQIPCLALDEVLLFAPTSENSDGNATTQSLKVLLFSGSRSGQNRGEVQSSFKVANIELPHCLTDHPSICMEKIFLWESGERTANSFTKMEEGDFSVSLSPRSKELSGVGKWKKMGRR